MTISQRPPGNRLAVFVIFSHMNKVFFLFYIALLTFCAIALANTCTDAVYKRYATIGYNPETDAHVDSLHLKFLGLDFEQNTKVIYTNKKIDHQKNIDEDNFRSIYSYYYYDTDESALSNTNFEYLLSKCVAHDTLCIQGIGYDYGVYNETDIFKITPNYTRQEIVSGEGEDLTYALFENFLKKDTVITVNKMDIKNDSARITIKTVYVADSLDDFKCRGYEDDSVEGYSITYKTTEKGFSLTITNDSTYINEVFYVVPGQTTSIRKTLKPVKISPKARYFDLLGRYKFSK